jgi:acyl-CoA thioesterase FadM
VVFQYRVERPEDGALLCTAETSLISLDRANRPTRLPAPTLAIMQAHVAGDA